MVVNCKLTLQNFSSGAETVLRKVLEISCALVCKGQQLGMRYVYRISSQYPTTITGNILLNTSPDFYTLILQIISASSTPSRPSPSRSSPTAAETRVRKCSPVGGECLTMVVDALRRDNYRRLITWHFMSYFAGISDLSFCHRASMLCE
jgi:hypothetical protein